MQLRLLISIVFLHIAAVLAGGRLNAEADRTLGYKCKSWDPTNGACRPNKKGVVQWQPCKGALPNRKCNFSDLLNTLGGVSGKDEPAADKDGKLLSKQETNPDLKATAKNAKCVTWVGDVVAKAVTDGKKTSDNEWLFERFNEYIEKIRFARDIIVKTESVGPGQNPLDPTRKWETVNWEKTMSDAVGSKYDMEKLQTITQDVKDKFYLNAKAREYRAVIQAYASVDTKVKGY
ncbi:hypothetical protein B0J13DRAFT_681382 [Dactylonectria estremocensis]|uniref:Uncharacterized protein n=1 Tax=Dactylonectria estremocensis TaxID=1079267 RepID=A0A9P9DA08_9HYPO|nr:hypothetical protein B0J13DRAFT_681382 [Dactylonectria estremocensis]